MPGAMSAGTCSIRQNPQTLRRLSKLLQIKYCTSGAQNTGLCRQETCIWRLPSVMVDGPRAVLRRAAGRTCTAAATLPGGNGTPSLAASLLRSKPARRRTCCKPTWRRPQTATIQQRRSQTAKSQQRTQVQRAAAPGSLHSSGAWATCMVGRVNRLLLRRSRQPTT